MSNHKLNQAILMKKQIEVLRLLTSSNRVEKKTGKELFEQLEQEVLAIIPSHTFRRASDRLGMSSTELDCIGLKTS